MIATCRQFQIGGRRVVVDMEARTPLPPPADCFNWGFRNPTPKAASSPWGTFLFSFLVKHKKMGEIFERCGRKAFWCFPSNKDHMRMKFGVTNGEFLCLLGKVLPGTYKTFMKITVLVFFGAIFKPFLLVL